MEARSENLCYYSEPLYQGRRFHIVVNDLNLPTFIDYQNFCNSLFRCFYFCQEEAPLTNHLHHHIYLETYRKIRISALSKIFEKSLFIHPHIEGCYQSRDHNLQYLSKSAPLQIVKAPPQEHSLLEKLSTPLTELVETDSIFLLKSAVPLLL
jgi:hypothetical protein